MELAGSHFIPKNQRAKYFRLRVLMGNEKTRLRRVAYRHSENSKLAIAKARHKQEQQLRSAGIAAPSASKQSPVGNQLNPQQAGHVLDDQSHLGDIIDIGANRISNFEKVEVEALVKN